MWKYFLFMAIAADSFFFALTDDSCSNCTGENEEYVQCNEDCSPQSCDSISKSYNCPAQPDCGGSCRCQSGYVRNGDKECIPVQDCTTCGGDPNAVPGCGNNCGRLCSNYQNPVLCPREECTTFENCVCKDGYVFDSNTKECVVPEDCTLQCTGAHEEYIQCNEDCSPQSCDSISKSYNCPAHPDCGGSCRCQSGYFRNGDKECIPVQNCTTCGGDPNAVPSCGNNCGRLCSNYQNPVLCPREECTTFENCVCKDGYVFDSNTKECVVPEDCTLQCTGANEEYVKCPTCAPQTCDSIGKGYEYNCPEEPADCIPACRCKYLYIRNDNDECVSNKECTSCGGDENAHPGCGINCGRYCSNYQSNDTICTTICKDGCDCNCGYVKDDVTGDCVLPEDCPTSSD